MWTRSCAFKFFLDVVNMRPRGMFSDKKQYNKIIYVYISYSLHDSVSFTLWENGVRGDKLLKAETRKRLNERNKITNGSNPKTSCIFMILFNAYPMNTHYRHSSLPLTRLETFILLYHYKIHYFSNLNSFFMTEYII